MNKKPLVTGPGIHQELLAADDLLIPSGNLTDGSQVINIATLSGSGSWVFDYVESATGLGPYVLTASPKSIILLFRSGGPQIPSIDFTVVGNQVTFLGSDVPAGEKLLIYYEA
jgi:hypothetical protein